MKGKCVKRTAQYTTVHRTLVTCRPRPGEFFTWSSSGRNLRKVHCHVEPFFGRLSPCYRLLGRWFNWRVALLSAVNRGILFFAVALAGGWRAAAAALAVEFAFRGVSSGVDGALAEALRDVRPTWLAGSLITVVIPLAMNALEYGVHRSQGTENLSVGAAVSLAVTAFSSLFNWYAMRHGVLLAAQPRQSFAADLRSLPGTLAGFLLVVPRMLLRAQAAVLQPRAAEGEL